MLVCSIIQRTYFAYFAFNGRLPLPPKPRDNHTMSRLASNLLQLIIKPALMGALVAIVVLGALAYLDRPSPPRQAPTQSVASYAEAVNSASPAVVNIYTTQSVRYSAYDPRPRTSERLGSGVIMNERGFILTANHVVAGVD